MVCHFAKIIDEVDEFKSNCNERAHIDLVIIDSTQCNGVFQLSGHVPPRRNNTTKYKFCLHTPGIFNYSTVGAWFFFCSIFVRIECSKAKGSLLICSIYNVNIAHWFFFPMKSSRLCHGLLVHRWVIIGVLSLCRNIIATVVLCNGELAVFFCWFLNANTSASKKWTQYNCFFF